MSGARRPGSCSPLVRAVCSAVAVVIAGGLIAAGAAPAQEKRGFAYSFEITGGLDQRTVHHMQRGLDDAKAKGASVVIIRLDTPGGTVDSVRTMVKRMAAAPMPVIVYVHPAGGRAASGGMFLTIAGDVAAMSPATNIGSATVVLGRRGSGSGSEAQEQLLKDLRRKSLEDVVALARSLAEEHGRNADLAERMVRLATNVSASRALRENIVDFVAASERSLLRKIDGFRIKGSKAQTLRTAGLEIRRISPRPVVKGAKRDLDESSLVRSLAYVFGPIIMLPLLVVGYRRARPRWRRALRRRRVRKLRRERRKSGKAEIPDEALQ